MQRAKETEQRAAQWLARRDSGNWSQRDQMELDQWLSESTANVVAFVRLESVWTRADRLQALGAGFPRGKVPAPEQLNLSPFFESYGNDSQRSQISASSDDAVRAGAQGLRMRRVRRALAAGLALALVGAAAWFYSSAGPDYKTPIGVTASVPMADGSSVTLNTDSAIRVVLTARERDVTLDQGEAFFEVAHDPNRPFVVRAGNRRIIAVGTKFSVRRLGNDVRVFVAEGRVRVDEGEGGSVSSPRGKSAAGDRANARVASSPLHLQEESSGEIFLAAGGIARTDGEGVLVQEESLAEVEESLSWRTGYMIFHESTLADAVAELNRYNVRQIVIEDPDIAAIKLSGKFRTTDFEAFVRLITSGFPIHVRQSNDRIILTKD